MSMPDPLQWTEAWVIFNAVEDAPLLCKIDNRDSKVDPADRGVERAVCIFQTEAAGLAYVRKMFGVSAQDPRYPHRFPVRPMPRDVPDCLHELQERLNLQAFTDGETVWMVRDLQ
jgi:hypothetical protein